MTVMDAIRKRYSCRKYNGQAIDRKELDQIFEAARLAPSAKNLQDWRFVVVTEGDLKRKLVKAANDQKFLADAGAIIVACSVNDYVMRCGLPIGPIDVSIALEHICLQAAELGLATCWIGSFYPEKVSEILEIPEGVQVIELLALGYSGDEGKRKTERSEIEDIFCFEKWKF